MDVEVEVVSESRVQTVATVAVVKAGEVRDDEEDVVLPVAFVRSLRVSGVLPLVPCVPSMCGGVQRHWMSVLVMVSLILFGVTRVAQADRDLRYDGWERAAWFFSQTIPTFLLVHLWCLFQRRLPQRVVASLLHQQHALHTALMDAIGCDNDEEIRVVFDRERRYARGMMRTHTRLHLALTAIAWILFNGRRVGNVFRNERPDGFDTSTDEELSSSLGPLFSLWAMWASFHTIHLQVILISITSVLLHVIGRRVKLLREYMLLVSKLGVHPSDRETRRLTVTSYLSSIKPVPEATSPSTLHLNPGISEEEEEGVGEEEEEDNDGDDDGDDQIFGRERLSTQPQLPVAVVERLLEKLLTLLEESDLMHGSVIRALSPAFIWGAVCIGFWSLVMVGALIASRGDWPVRSFAHPTLFALLFSLLFAVGSRTSRQTRVIRKLLKALTESVRGEQQRARGLRATVVQDSISAVDELPKHAKVRQMWSVYSRFLRNAAFALLVCLSVAVLRMKVQFPTCVKIDSDRSRTSDCSSSWHVPRALESASFGYMYMLCTPIFFSSALVGYRVAKVAFPVVVSVAAASSITMLVLMLVYGVDETINEENFGAWTIQVCLSLFTGWAVGRVLNLSSFKFFFAAGVIIICICIAIQSNFIIPFYEDVSSDAQRVLVVVVIHPIFRIGSGLAFKGLGLWARQHYAKVTAINNLFIFLALPELFFTFLARFFLVGIEDIPSQLTAAVLLAIIEVVVRSTASLRTYVLLRLFMCQDHASAQRYARQERAEETVVAGIYYRSFLELFSILFCFSYFFIAKAHLGQTIDSMLVASCLVQILLEMVGDMLAIAIDSNYLERNVLPIWSRMQRKQLFLRLTVPFALLSIIYSSVEFLVLVRSTGRNL